jgi:hypothetical protein
LLALEVLVGGVVGKMLQIMFRWILDPDTPFLPKNSGIITFHSSAGSLPGNFCARKLELDAD